LCPADPEAASLESAHSKPQARLTVHGTQWPQWTFAMIDGCRGLSGQIGCRADVNRFFVSQTRHLTRIPVPSIGLSGVAAAGVCSNALYGHPLIGRLDGQRGPFDVFKVTIAAMSITPLSHDRMTVITYGNRGCSNFESGRPAVHDGEGRN
jgi:hypothetical protein